MQLTNGGRLEGIEKEASDAVARKLNRPPEGFFIPHDVAARSLADVNGLSTRDLLTLSASVGQLQERVLGVSGLGSGGATVDTQVLGSALIELLRNRPLVAQMGAMTFSGLVGNIAVPRQTGAGTAYTLSEAAAVTLADQSFGQLGLSPKRVSGGTAYQKELLMQSSIDVEGFVRNDLLRIVLIKKDLLMLIGLGGAGEPIGILNTTGIGSETFGAAATWAKIVDFEKLVAVANADVGRIGWLTTPGVRAKWKQNAKIGSTFPNFIWEVGPDPRNPLVGTVNNYPAYVTNQVPGDQVLFGNFGDCLIGDWAGIDIVVDPYTQKKSAQVEIVINIWFDFGLRHAVSMVVSTDSGAQ
jgi:HK97 family phage major capsid protein